MSVPILRTLKIFRCILYFKCVHLSHTLLTHAVSVHSALAQSVGWCRQAAMHCLNPCWPNYNFWYVRTINTHMCISYINYTHANTCMACIRDSLWHWVTVNGFHSFTGLFRHSMHRKSMDLGKYSIIQPIENAGAATASMWAATLPSTNREGV